MPDIVTGSTALRFEGLNMAGFSNSATSLACLSDLIARLLPSLLNFQQAYLNGTAPRLSLEGVAFTYSVCPEKTQYFQNKA